MDDLDVCGPKMMPSVVEDPAGYDEPSDPVVVTTRRGISRIAFVAAEVAARFQREGIEYDPVAWMMASRRLFDGSAALDACLERQSFLRAAILHGLSKGLDALPEQIDPLIEDDDDDELETDYIEEAFAQSCSPGHRGRMGVIGGDGVSLSVPHYRAPARFPARQVSIGLTRGGTDLAVRSTTRINPIDNAMWQSGVEFRAARP